MLLQDYFAGLALQAIISKLPLLDNEGEYGRPQPENIKAQIAASAQEYAWHMMNERRKYEDATFIKALQLPDEYPAAFQQNNSNGKV